MSTGLLNSSLFAWECFSDEIKSVYVRNLLPTVSPSEVEEEFKNFGRIRPDGVVIRSRKVLCLFLCK